MMPGLLPALLAALLLGGCAFTSLDHGLGGLVGQDVDKAVARLGAPDAQRWLGTVRELEWNNFSNRAAALDLRSNDGFQMQRVASFAPPASSGLASVPRPGISASSNYVGTRPQYCKVIVQVDSRDVIRDYHYDGNFEGCYTYGQLLAKSS